MTVKPKIQLKNVGTTDLPAIPVNNKVAVYVRDGNTLNPAQTRHGQLRSITLTQPEFARAKNRDAAFKKEVANTKDFAYVWKESVIFDPTQGKIGAFYTFDHATKSSVIFTFWKENK
jgi:hypothetical protein